jgi:predicted amidophosphoribosyltransferase
MAATRLLAIADDIATEILGETLPPPARVIAAAGWRPDDAGDYCGRCGVSAGPGAATSDGCAVCRATPRVCDLIVRLGAYEDPLRTWIRQVKYGGRWFEMGQLLGRRLGAIMRERGVEPDRAVVVPMPMPWARRAQRGIDHARVLADGVGRGLGAPVLPLLRRRAAIPQASLSRGLRRRGGRGVHLARSPPRLAGLDAILVDDVLTTGATLRAAARQVRRLGPERVCGAIAAVTDPPGRGRPRRPDANCPV